MWTLQALSRGYLTQSIPAEWRVHSVFRRAVNLEAGGALITLLAQDYANVPAGIRINMQQFDDWRQWLSPGMLFVYRGEVLRCRIFSLPLHRVAVWQPAQGRYRLSAEGASAALVGLIRQLVDYCQTQRIRSQLPLFAILRDGAGPRLLLAESAAEAEAEVHCLVGFGSGLTPDGDDFLVGYLAATGLAECAIPIQGGAQRRWQILRAIAARLDSTNDISRHYLSLALQGHYSEPIHRLLAALSVSTLESMAVSAAQDILQQGSASGADCLSGIIHGLKQVCGEEHFR